MKRLLLIEEQFLVDRFTPVIQSWGYEVVGISKSDFVLEVIKRHQVDIIVLAKEMRISGEALYEMIRDNPDASMNEHLAKLHHTKVDFEWGLWLTKTIREAGVKLPIICLTTDELPGPQMQYETDDVFFDAVVSKQNNPEFYSQLENVLRQAK